MGKKELFYIKVLSEELEKRKAVNKKYSLRAFASRMQVDPTYLSKCLSGKQAMSFEIAEKVMTYLAINAEDRIEFLKSIAEQQSCMSLYKHDPIATTCEVEE